jgi:hypothetical protein
MLIMTDISVIQTIIISIITILIILSNIPYQGGGDYRGIYDIGLKRGFMGYIGLLLNAPYKRDSMVWMWMWMMLWNLLCFLTLCLGFGLYEPEGKIGGEALKCV